MPSKEKVVLLGFKGFSVPSQKVFGALGMYE